MTSLEHLQNHVQHSPREIVPCHVADGGGRVPPEPLEATTTPGVFSIVAFGVAGGGGRIFPEPTGSAARLI